jgi:ribosomal peptide maturation radical SAM protein 1
MIDVALVLMPYAAIQRPSIGLGLLKASLEQNQISSKVVYPNIWFAQEIGLDVYAALSNILTMDFVGEWTFSGAAFPDFQPDHSEYLRLVLEKGDYSRYFFGRDPQEVLLEVRSKVSSFIDRVAQSVLDLQPKIVGSSSTFAQHCASLALLRRIRELNPEVITLMGGANCEEVMGVTTHREFPWVDFIVSGEGDELFPDLCRKILDRGRDLDPLYLPYGVIGPAHRRDTVVKAMRASVQNLDRVPIPDYDDYFQTIRTSKIAPYIQPGLLLETARGCWWGQKHHCTFCGLNGSGMSYRSKSPNRVLDEFTQLSQKYGLQKIEVVDNILDMTYIDTVLPTLALAPEPYKIFYETKANLRREQMQKLASAGVLWIQPGIENMHEKALKLLNKGNTAWMNVQLLKWARELGISVSWNFLVGIPGEKDEWYSEIAEWLPLITHLEPSGSIYEIRYDRFSPYHEQPANWGLTLSPNPMYTYIYPLSIEKLADLAYFFEDCKDSVLGQTGAISRPGFKRLGECIREWHQCWQYRFSKPDDLPILSMSDNCNRITLFDTRPCAYERQQILDGLAYWVYKACDRALTHRELVTALRTETELDISWEDIQPIIIQLQERKIMLELNGRLLSLAVKKPYSSLPKSSESPGGYIDILGFHNSKQVSAIFNS